MDFTKIIYEKLLDALKIRFEHFFSLLEYYVIEENQLSAIIFRHDVDELPNNALKLADLEYSLGLKGTYYFRIVPESYDLDVMNKIALLGHEIGYHYEDVDLIAKKQRKNRALNNREELIDNAYESFCKNLTMIRKHHDIKTICMHGSPRSMYDNRMIWEKYNYKELGIIADAYLDIDFNEFAYFTDTGRRWNGHRFSVRDKVQSKYNFNYKSTNDIIENINELPDKIMFTIHPQRWNDSTQLWIKELIIQNIKNVVKYFYSKSYNK